jgi:hypothetical protein
MGLLSAVYQVQERCRAIVTAFERSGALAGAGSAALSR